MRGRLDSNSCSVEFLLVEPFLVEPPLVEFLLVEPCLWIPCLWNPHAPEFVPSVVSLPKQIGDFRSLPSQSWASVYDLFNKEDSIKIDWAKPETREHFKRRAS